MSRNYRLMISVLWTGDGQYFSSMNLALLSEDGAWRSDDVDEPIWLDLDGMLRCRVETRTQPPHPLQCGEGFSVFEWPLDVGYEHSAARAIDLMDYVSFFGFFVKGHAFSSFWKLHIQTCIRSVYFNSKIHTHQQNSLSTARSFSYTISTSSSPFTLINDLYDLTTSNLTQNFP